MEYASKGVAGSGLGLGIAGTALGVLNGGLTGLNVLGRSAGMGTVNVCSENMPVTRYEMSLAQELANKDGEIALLKADKYTDQKLVEVYEAINSKVNALADKVQSNKDEQYAINLNQAVLNGTTGSTIACLQAQIAQLQGLTKIVVPNTSVCPGWGDVTITATTTSAA